MDDKNETTTEYRVRHSSSDGTRWLYTLPVSSLEDAARELERISGRPMQFGGPDRDPRIERRTVTVTVTASPWKAPK